MRFHVLLVSVLSLATSGALQAQCFEAELTNLDASQGDHVGNGVSVHEGVLIAGAKGKNENGQDSGAAYIYERGAGAWVQVAKLAPADIAMDDEFGVYVALHSGVAVVGSFHDDDDGSNSGSAYVFEKVAGTWTQVAKLTASDASAGANFGACVAVDAGRILVGAQSDSALANNAGSAYVFEKLAGSWQEVQKLSANDAQPGDFFGHSVAIDGDLIAIGAPNSDDGGSLAGSAYVFLRSALSWSQEAKMLATDGAAGDRYGRTISISGNRLLVGAEFDDDGGADTGSAYVLERSAGTWSETHKFTASDGDSGDLYGRAVAIWGERVLVGSFGDDDLGSDAGAAYLYELSPLGWSLTSKILAPAGNAGDRFGRTASLRGGELALGAPLTETAASNAGSAYIYDLGSFDSYCSSSPNSSGAAASVSATGSASISANHLRLFATSVPNQPGLFFLGPDQVALPFGNGLRCAGGQFIRLPPVFASNNVLAYDLDHGSPLLAGAISPGSTWNFQAWFRDPAAGGANFDLSDGLSITFCP